MASIQRYTTKKGTRWRVQYRDPAGKSRTKSGFQRKRDAETWAATNTVQQEHGDWVSPEARRTTINDYAETWLKRVNTLAPSSQRVYRIAWDRHVKPRWGATPITAIKPSHVQEWIDTSANGAVTVRRNVDVLAQIIALAVDDGVLRTNAARGRKLPRKPKPVHVFLTMDQLSMLAGECSKHQELVWLLGTVGLRWGEAAALRPCDLDPLRSRIHISRNAVTVGTDVHIGDTKTGEKRDVSVAPSVMHRVVDATTGRPADELIWQSPGGGPLKLPSSGSWFSEAVKRIRRREPDFPEITPHGLRHVAAGLMVNAGANVLQVARQLGHADPSITLRVYASLWEDGLDALGSVMEKEILCRENVVDSGS